MRCLLEERHFNETEWPTLIQEVTFTCNSYVNASTGCSPHEVMYGALLRSKADVIFPLRRPRDFPNISSFCKHAEEARLEVAQRVYNNLQDSRQTMDINYNRGTKSSDIGPGDWV